MANTIGSPSYLDPKLNRLLATLDIDDCSALMDVATAVSLKFRKKILLQDDQVTFVYFPFTCMFSILVTERDKLQLELATIGKEGAVGISEALGKQPAIGLHLIQIPGTALRISAKDFREVASRHPQIERLAHSAQYACLRQILYSAACNRLHSMEERCARWLLMTHDRADEDVFPLTQEFLSHMLGVRRATVNVATGMLKKAGFISFTRGKVAVLDRAGLQSAACSCYQSVVDVYDSQIAWLSNSKKRP